MRQQRHVPSSAVASTLSHAELDEAEELDAGDLGLMIVGGCCGTDSRHAAALMGL